MTSSLQPDVRPLILTLRLNCEHQRRFDDLRRAHFPPARNYLAAHVTLFHQLPGGHLHAVSDHLRLIAASQLAPDVLVEDVISIGRGVSFRLRSTTVEMLKRRLVAEWGSELTPQDRQAGRLHVTVQNKVDVKDARTLLSELKARFVPSSFIAPGLDLWRYLGGPWEHVAAFDFSAGPAGQNIDR